MLQIEVNQAPYTVQQWLTAGSTWEQLAAAGYAPQVEEVLEQLEQRLDESPATPDSQDSLSTTAAEALMEDQEFSLDLAAAVMQGQGPVSSTAADLMHGLRCQRLADSEAVLMEAQEPSFETVLAAALMEFQELSPDADAAVMQSQDLLEPLSGTAADFVEGGLCLDTESQELKSLGLALCSFAVPCMCNNPGCASMAGLSELASVSGRSCVCGGCRVARYCGRACQRAVWKQHKPVCAALSAAGGGAGVAVDAGAAAGGS
jgi:hypothetical protein